MRGLVWILLSLGLAGVLIGQGCANSKPISQTASAASTGSCATPAGFSGQPQSIEEAIAMINALPKPVTVDCFLKSLRRPLHVNMTNSRSSAQPAFSSRSPRIFILIDKMTISVVPEGLGSQVIEFSVMTTATESIKGELPFPVEAPLAPTAAYDRIRYGAGTVCGFCHTNEWRALNIGGEAFTSMALQPRFNTQIALDSMRVEWMTCNAKIEPERCRILEGLFGFGEVEHKNFPAALLTF